MGPIQTAIGQLMGVVGGAALVGKKIQNENERQAAKEAGTQKEEEKTKAGSQGSATSEAMKQEVVDTAQKKGIVSPRNIVFSQDGTALASRDELAALISQDAGSRRAASKRKTKKAIKDKIAYIRARAQNTMAER